MKKIITTAIVTVLIINYIIANPIVNNDANMNNKVFAASQSEEYTGEELFEGIFFGYGDVAKKFPMLWEDTEFKDFKVTQDYIEQVRELEKLLKKENSDYFVQFKKDVISGDRLRIKNQFSKVKEDITKLAQEFENNTTKDGIQPRGLKPGFVVALAYSYVGATHIAAAAVLTVVIAGHKVAIAGPKSIQPGLSEDQYIDEIAKKLGED